MFFDYHRRSSAQPIANSRGETQTARGKGLPSRSVGTSVSKVWKVFRVPKPSLAHVLQSVPY